MLKILSVVTALLLLTACGSDDTVPMEIVDGNQIISKENATSNARSYVAETYPGKTVGIQFMSDSTISPSCRHGDGWASGKLTLEDNTQVSLKCQTTGSGKGISGCLEEADFDTKSYASEDGRCNTAIQSLKRITG